MEPYCIVEYLEKGWKGERWVVTEVATAKTTDGQVTACGIQGLNDDFTPKPVYAGVASAKLKILLRPKLIDPRKIALGIPLQEVLRWSYGPSLAGALKTAGVLCG